MDHAHHMHHGHHSHTMQDNSTEDFSPTTVASTLMSAVATTFVTHHKHTADHQPYETMVADSPIHATHSTEDHMPMYFHFSVDSIILFKQWTTSTTQGLIFSILGIIILAMIYEGIKFFREFLFKKYFTSLEYSSVSVLGDDGKPITEVHKVARNRMFSWSHLLQTILHVIQMVLSYFLMLIFMTFNIWLCAGVIIGAGIGYFLFGWRKATVVDITEHCH